MGDTVYPGAVDTWNEVYDNLDVVQAAHVNDAHARIIAIEETLGVSPQAGYTTIGERIGALESIYSVEGGVPVISGLPEAVVTYEVTATIPAGKRVVYLGRANYYEVGRGDILAVEAGGSPLAYQEMYRDEYAPMRYAGNSIRNVSWAIRLDSAPSVDTDVTVRWRERYILYSPLNVYAVPAGFPAAHWKNRTPRQVVDGAGNVNAFLIQGVPSGYEVEVWRVVRSRARRCYLDSCATRQYRGRKLRPLARYAPDARGRVVVSAGSIFGNRAWFGTAVVRLYNPITGARSHHWAVLQAKQKDGYAAWPAALVWL